MKPTYLCLAAIGALMIAGCDRSKEFEAEKALLMSRSDSLKYVIAERDGYFDEVVSSIHDVYNNLEIARSKEEQLLKQTGHGEGNMSLTSESAKADLLREIAAVDKTLTENRDKIKRLQGKVKGFEKEFASLNAMIADLKKNLEERESTIASLQGNISGLEQDVANKTQMVAYRDSVIGKQESEINTVYIVSGKRSELEEKGIITDEGGFLWGLLGSTTVVAPGIDQQEFIPLDKTREQVITVNGKIDEILPKRSDQSYSLSERGESGSDLTVVNPEKFWHEKYLVVIID